LWSTLIAWIHHIVSTFFWVSGFCSFAADCLLVVSVSMAKMALCSAELRCVVCECARRGRSRVLEYTSACNFTEERAGD